jgi:N-methylhydantoinase B
MGRYELKAGDCFYLQSPGGGGFGDPSMRDGDAIRKDIAEGYVTEEGAKADYGRDDP